MRRIERADYQQTPWKNGSGTTTQIAIYPENATTDDFEWRISMAAVATDGPFSEFPGIDRSLVVLEGAGINLKVAGNPVERIERGSDAFGFAADAVTVATLIDGPILDLNIMTRRDVFSHRVWRYARPAVWASSGGLVVLFAQSTGLQIDDGKQSIRMKSGDTMVFDDDARRLDIVPESVGDYYLIEFAKIEHGITTF